MSTQKKISEVVASYSGPMVFRLTYSGVQAGYYSGPHRPKPSMAKFYIIQYSLTITLVYYLSLNTLYKLPSL
jgi:hypothetical protein